jgi:hypothetical protein
VFLSRHRLFSLQKLAITVFSFFEQVVGNEPV